MSLMMTRQANPKRRSALRLRAVVLLVCLLAGPLRMLAYPWFHGRADCCAAGMCKTHKPAQEQRKAQTACDHGKNMPDADCTMKCSETSKESAVVSPGIPETILISEIAIAKLSASRAEVTLTSLVFKSQVPIPLDQPPRS